MRTTRPIPREEIPVLTGFTMSLKLLIGVADIQFPTLQTTRQDACFIPQYFNDVS